MRAAGCLSAARSRSFSLAVCRAGGCQGVDITGQYSSESRVEFGVVKSTGKQKRMEKGKKKNQKKPKGAELDSPGISNPIPATLHSADAAHYNQFANADPLLPR